MAKTKSEFSIDFTDSNESGFVTAKPGEYEVMVGDWFTYIKEESGNRVFEINTKVLNGDYKDTAISAYQTLSNTQLSKNMFLKMLADLGIVKESDRGADRKLDIQFATEEVEGDFDEPRIQVKYIIVNGDKRKPSDRKALAVVTNYKDDDGNPRHSIKSLLKHKVPADSADSGLAVF
jgi:hypothetical protein